jgi:hypothetical protein
MRCVPFHPLELGQPVVPLSLQSPGDLPVLRIHGHELAVGQFGLLTGALEGQFPLAIGPTSPGGNLVEAAIETSSWAGRMVSRKVRATVTSISSPRIAWQVVPA